MKLGSLIWLGAGLCLVGIMMPADHSRMNDPPQAVSGTGSLTVDAVEPFDHTGSQDYLGGEMVLQQQSDGHFYASPSINSVPVDALIDTGASVIALTGADAEAIGLSWDQSQIRTVGRGASGPVQGVAVRLDKVELGSFEVHDVDAMIIPEGLHVTLLGQSFLSRIPEVQISDGKMRLAEY
ncbi:retropepsin-like aspartic protease family protein [Croceicoccus bisphenolivorans]|uniref:retropepsin-like aspartic protease family protein n=1 Tax=Croceicoccus bisphenolivorans TaxID=1783232 RepID=UPI0015600C11|nr:TIGR02281 family clan AA aspartic protease [Croceicoccus bisphenolivorans]